MKPIQTIIGFTVLAAVIAGAWLVGFHSDWITPKSEGEEEAEVETDVSVKTAPIVRATLRRYVEGYGAVEEEPALGGKPAAGAQVASPVSALVDRVLCEAGQKVEKGAVLFQLDERLAKAQEEQAQAALASAGAALARLKATPRPEQVEVAQLAIDKANGTVELARSNYDRLKKLGPEQATSAKSIQSAQVDLNAAEVDLKTAQKQLALLKSSPTAEELAEAAAKVTESERALAVAQAQRSLLTLRSPIAGTVLRVAVTAGGSVDSTKVLAEIVALDRLIVNASVSATELRTLKPGMAVEIEAPLAKSAGPGVWLPGTVKWIGKQVDRKTDSVQVWIALAPDAGLVPGQYVRVRIIAEEHANRLAVPVESLVQDPEGHPVVSVVDQGKATRKSVTVGIRDRTLAEIEAEGLKEGDRVVTEGAYALPQETKVHPVGQ